MRVRGPFFQPIQRKGLVRRAHTAFWDPQVLAEAGRGAVLVCRCQVSVSQKMRSGLIRGCAAGVPHHFRGPGQCGAAVRPEAHGGGAVLAHRGGAAARWGWQDCTKPHQVGSHQIQAQKAMVCIAAMCTWT